MEMYKLYLKLKKFPQRLCLIDLQKEIKEPTLYVAKWNDDILISIYGSLKLMNSTYNDLQMELQNASEK